MHATKSLVIDFHDLPVLNLEPTQDLPFIYKGIQFRITTNLTLRRIRDDISSEIRYVEWIGIKYKKLESQERVAKLHCLLWGKDHYYDHFNFAILDSKTQTLSARGPPTNTFLLFYFARCSLFFSVVFFRWFIHFILKVAMNFESIFFTVILKLAWPITEGYYNFILIGDNPGDEIVN